MQLQKPKGAAARQHVHVGPTMLHLQVKVAGMLEIVRTMFAVLSNST